MGSGKWIVVFAGALLAWARVGWAVAPGGIYSADASMPLNIESRQWPHTLGYHVLRGTTIYHGRKLPFESGVFLPATFFHAQNPIPMPMLMALHNRSAIGGSGGSQIIGEGMGRVLAYGGEDGRAVGDKAQNPIVLRQQGQFIGLIPQCPGGFGWESPPIAKLLCNFIAQAVSRYRADGDRVYLTGFSYGASSTWRVALQAPDRFAAIIVCDGRASPDPVRDVQKLKDLPVYLEVGQWDGPFVEETDRMHQALNLLPHRNYIFRMIPGGNHFCYQTVYDDPEVWKWIFAQRRKGDGEKSQ